MKRWVRSHSLSLVILAGLIAMLAGTLLLGPGQYMQDRQTTTLDGFWSWWGFETILSLEADVWGALILILGTRWLWQRGSAEAFDPPEDREEEQS